MARDGSAGAGVEPGSGGKRFCVSPPPGEVEVAEQEA